MHAFRGPGWLCDAAVVGKGPGKDRFRMVHACILGTSGGVIRQQQGRGTRISKKITQKKWKVAWCDNQHSVTCEDRVMNRSSLGKGKDRQQVVVGKSSGKSDTILYSGWKPILYILLGA